MPSNFSFDVGTHGRVSGAIYRAADPIQATLILAHGAGAGRTHAFMTGMAERIAKKGVDVYTFNFLYMEQGRKMPDRPELLEACWLSAIASVRARGGFRNERFFIGGKSLGGRMAARVAAMKDSIVVSGVAILGYPLHPAGNPRVVRPEILRVSVPVLVVQGARDELGTAAELKKLLKPLPNARVFVVDGADHSLALPKRGDVDGDRQETALDGAASAISAFIASPTKPRAKRTTARSRAKTTKARAKTKRARTPAKAKRASTPAKAKRTSTPAKAKRASTPAKTKRASARVHAPVKAKRARTPAKTKRASARVHAPVKAKKR